MPTCVVQLSDLHLSAYNASQFYKFGDRLGDLRFAFTHALSERTMPVSKLPLRRSQQEVVSCICIVLSAKAPGSSVLRHLIDPAMLAWTVGLSCFVFFTSWLVKSVLKSVLPKALIITGDLTDGKTTDGQGRQSLTEWEVNHATCQTFCLHLSMLFNLASN